MALTKASMKNKILTKIQACNSELDAAGIAIIDACLEAFCDGVIEEFQENATINMNAADFNVDPGTFQVSGQPVTGQGDNAAFNLTGKIQ